MSGWFTPLQDLSKFDPELQRLSDTERALRSALDYAIVVSHDETEIARLQAVWSEAVDELADAIVAKREPRPADRA